MILLSHPSTMDEAALVSTQHVLLHSTPDDCWVVIEGNVWDLTEFAHEHPGGASSKSAARFCRRIYPLVLTTLVIHKYAGKDATDAYLEVHSSSVARDTLSLACYKGALDPSTISAEWVVQQPEVRHAPSITAHEDAEKPPLQTILNR